MLAGRTGSMDNCHGEPDVKRSADYTQITHFDSGSSLQVSLNISDNV